MTDKSTIDLIVTCEDGILTTPLFNTFSCRHFSPPPPSQPPSPPPFNCQTLRMTTEECIGNNYFIESLSKTIDNNIPVPCMCVDFEDYITYFKFSNVYYEEPSIQFIAYETLLTKSSLTQSPCFDASCKIRTSYYTSTSNVTYVYDRNIAGNNSLVSSYTYNS